MSQGNTPYKVTRIDDNGVEYIIAKNLTLHEAEVLAKLMTERGHKQFYEVLKS